MNVRSLNERRCPACDGTGLQEHSTVRGRVLHCEACFHVWRITGAGYDYVSAPMAGSDQGPRLEAAAAFLEQVDLDHRKVLEIGCGRGALAKHLQSKFEFQIYDAVELSDVANSEGANIRRILRVPCEELVDHGELQQHYDLVIMAHVLEHCADLDAATEGIRYVMSHDALCYMEVPHRAGHPMFLFEENDAHEHFFSIRSITEALDRRGLEIIGIQSGSFLFERYADCILLLARHRRGYRSLRDAYSLGAPKIDGRIVVWGAGKPSVYELGNILPMTQIAYIVDVDPAKQGEVIQGLEVVAPSRLELEPEVTLYVNSLAHDAQIVAQATAEYGQKITEILLMRDVMRY